MKILLISSLALPTPPRNGGYGGLERVWHEHAKGLQELGHEVTLIGSKGSVAPRGVQLLEVSESWDKLTPEQQLAYQNKDGVAREWENIKWFGRTNNAWRAHEQEAFQIYKDSISDYDVIGDASWAKWSYSIPKEEIVGTFHSMQPASKPPREFAMFTGVSSGHARAFTNRTKIPHRTVWNPVDVEAFNFCKDKLDRVLSLNRIMPTKGIHIFMNIMEKLKFKADVAGDDITLVPDQNYVNTIKQACAKSANIVYYGLVEDKKRKELLANAKVLVCLKDMGYEEVFGLSAVEAMAAGTPVIALRSWGFESIIDKTCGVLCNSLEEVEKAIQDVVADTIRFNPEDCRKRAEWFKRSNVTKIYTQMLESVKRGSRW